MLRSQKFWKYRCWTFYLQLRKPATLFMFNHTVSKYCHGENLFVLFVVFFLYIFEYKYCLSLN